MRLNSFPSSCVVLDDCLERNSSTDCSRFSTSFWAGHEREVLTARYPGPSSGLRLHQEILPNKVMSPLLKLFLRANDGDVEQAGAPPAERGISPSAAFLSCNTNSPHVRHPSGTLCVTLRGTEGQRGTGAHMMLTAVAVREY